MRNGPVTSELLDLINAGRLNGESDHRWERSISDRINHEVKLESKPPREHVSVAELELLEAVWAEHGDRDQWQLVDWCHTHCGSGPRWPAVARPSPWNVWVKLWANHPKPLHDLRGRRRN